MRPTRTAIVVMALASVFAILPALGFPRTWPMVPVAWCVFGVLFIVDAVVSPRRGSVRVETRELDELHVGKAERFDVRVRARSWRTVPLEAALDLSEELEPQPHVHGVLGAGEAPEELAFELVPRRRGTARVERIWLKYASPFGLIEWLHEVPLEKELGVFPDMPTVRETAIRFFSDPTFRSGMKIEQYRGDGTEFEALKEFTLGDDHRALDWKASARHRVLLTRQFRAERNHQVCIAVDSGHLMGEPMGGIPKLDHALNAALLLSYVCLASGDRVGFFSFGATLGPGLPPLGGVGSIQSLNDVMSRVEYSTEETNFTLGLTSLAQRLERRSLIILLTDFVDTVTAELMIENVHRLGQRHLVVFVSLKDPALASIVEAEPRGMETLNRSVVAHGFVDAREVVHGRLRASGIQPLDVEPARIGPQLINRYLDIKRRELV